MADKLFEGPMSLGSEAPADGNRYHLDGAKTYRRKDGTGGLIRAMQMIDPFSVNGSDGRQEGEPRDWLAEVISDGPESTRMAVPIDVFEQDYEPVE